MSLRTTDSLAPLGVVAFAIAVLSILDAIIKGLAESVPVGQIVVLRYAFGALIALPFFLAARPKITRRSLKANALRSVVIAVTAGTFYHALATLPLAEALALSYCAPLFMALLGAVLLGERISREILAAIALGFGGVLVVLSAKFSGSVALDPRTLSGVIAALVSALSYAFAMVLLRRQSAFDSAPVLVFTQAAFAAILTVPSLAFGAVALDWSLLAGFAIVGVLGTIGHFAMAWGYARTEAARLGPIEYTSFLWASLIGYAVFREPLATETAIGAALIIAACFVAGRRRPAQAETAA